MILSSSNRTDIIVKRRFVTRPSGVRVMTTTYQRPDGSRYTR